MEVLIKNILTKLAYFNFIISLGAISLTYMVGSLLSISMAPNIYLLPFLVAMFVYSANRLTDIREDSESHPSRTQFVIKNYTLMKFVNIISFVLVIIFSLLHSFLTLLIICIPMILVIIYSVKLLPSSIFQKNRLKEYFLMKNIIVSTGWALIPVYVSVYTGVITPWIFLVSLFIFFRIFIGVIMFDIRDIHGDKIYKIDSLPIRLGEKKSKKLISILNVVSVLPILIGAIFGYFHLLTSLFISILALFMGIVYIKSKIEIKFLCDVIVDGEYVLLGLVSFLARSLA